MYVVRLVRLVPYRISIFYAWDQPDFLRTMLVKPRESLRRITAAEFFALASGSPLPPQEPTEGFD